MTTKFVVKIIVCVIVIIAAIMYMRPILHDTAKSELVNVYKQVK